jgi:diguanylate cyclase (GGDEF)-like protein
MPRPKGRDLGTDIRDLFAKARMPTSPALAARILELIRDPKSNAADFGRVLRTDPALSTRLLRLANSAAFAQRSAVTTVERAVTVLGLTRVKSTSLGFQLMMHLDRLGGAPFDMKAFWQHSLLRACLAQATAQRLVPDRAEEAFVVGLLQHCGIPLLVQFLGCGYASLCRSNLSPAAFYAVEKVSFPHTHVEAISVMASEWRFPPIISIPLERHHQEIQPSPEPSEIELLTAVSYFVGGLHFISDATVEPGEQELLQFAATSLGLDDAAWEQVQAQAAQEYRDISTVYQDLLPEDVDVTDLLSEANRQLASVADDADRRVLDIQAERDAIHRDQQRLGNALREYRERAALDPLTHLLNRGALAEATRRAMQQNLDEAVPIAVLFLDLDDFKRLNDTYGHEVGDHVLKAVAFTLGQEVGQTGTVGRYGGEEFVVLMQNVSADAARNMGERIVQRVRGLDMVACGACGAVTCSVGGIWCDDVRARSAEELLHAADERMYQAKRGGKDRCCFEALPAPDDSAERDDRSTTEGADRPLRMQKRGSGEDGVAAGIERLLAIARALNSAEEGPLVGIRKQDRKQLLVPCVLHCFTDTDSTLRSETAVARNISSGGIGLVVARPMVRGEAVEVVLETRNSKLYLAGLVAFGRHLEGAVHEVGVQFVTHSVTPIISGDASEAMAKYDWVARALSAKQEGKLEHRVSP